MFWGFRPPEAAPETESSDVPADVPSVTHRPFWPLASVPSNATSLPNCVKPVGLSPFAEAPVTESSDVPADVPSVIHRLSRLF